MESEKKFPGVGWLSSRLSVKFITIVVLFGVLSWLLLSLFFIRSMASYIVRVYGVSPDPALWEAVSHSAFVGLFFLNLVVFAVSAVLFFFLIIAPIIRLRKMMREYYESGKAPERTVRSDEIGRLQNTFADLTAVAEQKDQAQRRLIASISHDIKTPLTSVLGYSERLRSAELAPERREQYVDLIHEKALRLKAVVDEFDDYLDVSLRDTDPMRLMTAGELCRRLREEYDEELQDAGVTFRVQCYTPKAQIICNWEHMRRLFGNLISNSINHAGASRLELVVQCRQEGDRLCLSFQDNGQGVPPELLGRIFEPLYTSDKGRKVSGLGLSICQSIIKAHGGNLHAENVPAGSLPPLCGTVTNPNSCRQSPAPSHFD